MKRLNLIKHLKILVIIFFFDVSDTNFIDNLLKELSLLACLVLSHGQTVNLIFKTNSSRDKKSATKGNKSD